MVYSDLEIARMTVFDFVGHSYLADATRPYTQIPMPSERHRHQPAPHRAESELPSSVEASRLHLRA